MKTTLATWRDCSPYIAVYTVTIAKPAFGGLDQRTRLIIRPLSREQAEELARARGVNIQTPPIPVGVIPAVPVVHPSVLKEYLTSIGFALLGTSILWIGFILAIVAVRGLFGW